jgi:hypothetical protein
VQRGKFQISHRRRRGHREHQGHQDYRSLEYRKMFLPVGVEASCLLDMVSGSLE